MVDYVKANAKLSKRASSHSQVYCRMSATVREENFQRAVNSDHFGLCTSHRYENERKDEVELVFELKDPRDTWR